VVEDIDKKHPFWDSLWVGTPHDPGTTEFFGRGKWLWNTNTPTDFSWMFKIPQNMHP
jgi:hypothetical protein